MRASNSARGWSSIQALLAINSSRGGMPENQPTRAPGRPSGYSKKLGTLICKRIAEGESLRAICRDEGMPTAATVCNWLLDPEGKPEFFEQYARAREIQADLKFEEIQEIADDGSNDWMEQNSEEGSAWRFNGEHVQRSRLRVDTLKWRLARMNMKKYGDKSETTVKGDPTAPVPLILNGSDVNG